MNYKKILADELASFVSTVLNYMVGSGQLTKVKKILDQASAPLSAQNTLTQIYAIFKGLGIAIILFYFFLDLYESFSTSDITPERFVKSLLRMTISVFIMTNCVEIIRDIIGIGDAMSGGFVEKAATDTNKYKDGLDAISKYLHNKADISQTTTYAFLMCIIPYIIMQLTNIGIYLIVIARGLELIVRTAWAPIALADFYTERGHSQGLEYIRKLSALSVQGLTIVISLWATQFFSFTLLSSPGSKTDTNMPIYLDASGTLQHKTYSSDDDMYADIDNLKHLSSDTVLALMQYDYSIDSDTAEFKHVNDSSNPMAWWADKCAEKAKDGSTVWEKIKKTFKKIFENKKYEKETKENFVGMNLMMSLMSPQTMCFLCAMQLACFAACFRAGRIASDLFGG